MNNKAFTLVELLAVIVLLSALALISANAITGIFKNSKQELFNTQITLIKNAAEQWGGEFPELIPTANSQSDIIETYLNLSDLQEANLLDKDIENPLTKEYFNDDNVIIKVTSYFDLDYSKSVTKYEVITDIDQIEEIKQNLTGIM